MKKNLVAFVTRGFQALPENISHDLEAIVTKDFARFEKNLVALVTKIFLLCGYV